ncbi:hypothetical protein E3N88_23530 [Mikania micrantha]|uniref:Uncharacterized protein n=1 Tax=Mikania micrantha TaxID=192012 RepID=A0A5N6NEN3_9ASTR|nr:hypothetical protein E3N88_23530 [Mikania micrantha]
MFDLLPSCLGPVKRVAMSCSDTFAGNCMRKANYYFSCGKALQAFLICLALSFCPVVAISSSGSSLQLTGRRVMGGGVGDRSAFEGYCGGNGDSSDMMVMVGLVCQYHGLLLFRVSSRADYIFEGCCCHASLRAAVVQSRGIKTGR